MLQWFCYLLACSRHSDSRAWEKNSRRKKKRGDYRGKGRENLSNKIFLPFWASINDLKCTPSFHITLSSSMPSFCPQPMAGVAVIPNRLSLVSLWLREVQRWLSWKLTRQLFLWLRLLFVERVEKWRSPRARWKNRENVLASAIEIQANFLLFTKRFLIQCTGNARFHCL